MRNRILAGLLAFGIVATAVAQRQASPGDSVVSPSIADGAVTLSIYAPVAERVYVTGDWMTTCEALDLSRNADGICSVTREGLRPDCYSYGFSV
ncbi:MAG: esterase, partial [Gammaproteobacteria bacterium]